MHLTKSVATAFYLNTFKINYNHTVSILISDDNYLFQKSLFSAICVCLMGGGCWSNFRG